MAGAAIELHLEFDLGLAELLVNLGYFFERVGHVFGAMQDQELALGILRPSGRMTEERAVDRNVGGERRTRPGRSSPSRNARGVT